jgi:hypothetical protein
MPGHVASLARAFNPQTIEVCVLTFSEGQLVEQLRSEGTDVHVLRKRTRFDPMERIERPHLGLLRKEHHEAA